MSSRGLLMLVFVALLFALGCVERRISITSQPGGAIVYLNDEEVGRTPVTVPFTFYGVYDVRLEHEPVWMPIDAAAGVLGLTAEQVRQRIDGMQLDAQEADGQLRVLVYYEPLWTKQPAAMPWWELPGPDLIAETVPNNLVQLDWHFRLEPVGDMSSEQLIERGKQMRQILREQEAADDATKAGNLESRKAGD